METGLRTCAIGLLVTAIAWPAAAQTPTGEAFTVNTTNEGNKRLPDVAVGRG